MIELISAAVIPVMIVCAAVPMVSRRKDYFSVFISGAKDGLATAVNLLPAMIALTVALSMLQASGALEFLTGIVSAPAALLGIPAEIVPLIITRPISGSASTAAYAQLLDECGADSLAAFCASVMMGSSDTLIYIVSVYFSGAPGVRRTKHAVPVAAAVAVLCVFLACAVGRMFFAGNPLP